MYRILAILCMVCKVHRISIHAVFIVCFISNIPSVYDSSYMKDLNSMKVIINKFVRCSSLRVLVLQNIALYNNIGNSLTWPMFDLLEPLRNLFFSCYLHIFVINYNEYCQEFSLLVFLFFFSQHKPTYFVILIQRTMNIGIISYEGYFLHFSKEPLQSMYSLNHIIYEFNKEVMRELTRNTNKKLIWFYDVVRTCLKFQTAYFLYHASK